MTVYVLLVNIRTFPGKPPAGWDPVAVYEDGETAEEVAAASRERHGEMAAFKVREVSFVNATLESKP